MPPPCPEELVQGWAPFHFDYWNTSLFFWACINLAIKSPIKQSQNVLAKKTGWKIDGYGRTTQQYNQTWNKRLRKVSQPILPGTRFIWDWIRSRAQVNFILKQILAKFSQFSLKFIWYLLNSFCQIFTFCRKAQQLLNTAPSFTLTTKDFQF